MDFKRTRHLTEIPYEFSNPTHCMTSILEKKNRMLGRFQLFQVWMVFSSSLYIFSQVTKKNRWRTDSRSSAVILAIAEKKLEKKNHASTGIKPVCNEAFCINGYGICKDELRIRYSMYS